jgi:GxxExxY protein
MVELILKDEAYRIVGAAMEVYNSMGHGFLEAVYQECLCRELTDRRIPFTPQPRVQILYKNKPLDKEYIPDCIAFDQIIVEIKALDKLTGREESQMINYLRAANLPLGLILNFGAHPNLEWKRILRADNAESAFPVDSPFASPSPL